MTIQASTTPKTPEQTDSSGKKLVLYLVFFVLLIALFNFYPPAKLYLFNIGEKMQSFGWYGILLMMLISGCLLIPFGLPYNIFEMVLSFIIPHYVKVLILSMSCRMLGCFNSYFLGKYAIKNKIMSVLNKQKGFKAIQHLLEERPFYFSVLFRLMTLPYFVKNYALAIPDNVGFGLYMLAAFIGSAPYSVVQIYLFQQTNSINELLDGKKSTLQKAFSWSTLILTITIIIYLVRYTKKFMKNLEINEQNTGKKVQ